ncbi:MAG: hypothetical protein E7055_01375 [Lentisphaerae bacterium]|nr:hypothetical protein [Lentisphaerota bacterium]
MFCDDVNEKMENAIETGNLETVLQTASELGVDLKEDWTSTAAKAISCNFTELLKYLQQELQINYSEEIGKLSFEEREELDHSVYLAAQSGNRESIEYVIREFKSLQTFNAAFIGAAKNHQEDMLGVLYQLHRSNGFTIGNDTLSNALAAACSYRYTNLFEYLTGFSELNPVPSPDAYGDDAVDKLIERTLEMVHLLLTGRRNEVCGWTSTVDKAEQIVELLKKHHKTDSGKQLFQLGKKYLRDQKTRLPDFIKAEIMNKTSCPWFEPESTDRLPPLRTLWGRLKYIRRRLIWAHLPQADERIEKSGIPRNMQRRIRRQVVHALLTAYQDADSIADFHQRAQAYSDEILRKFLFNSNFTK